MTTHEPKMRQLEPRTIWRERIVARLWIHLCLVLLSLRICYAFVLHSTPIYSRHRVLYANVVDSRGSRLRVSEDEALHWFDEAYVKVRGGAGGQGANTFKFGTGRIHAFANGGSGGDGGNVYFMGNSNMNTLLSFRGESSFKAKPGEDGESHHVNGRQGESVYIQIPVGTTIINNETSEVTAEVTAHGQVVLAASGGLGGKGNAAAKKIAGKAQKSVPPTPPQSFMLKLELRLMADVGLVGIPNAGKSTLLSKMTKATPKIADYAFTTKIPNLGVCDVSSLQSGANQMVVADVPGLLEGAHRGVGLGRAFLRHIERCRLIIHIIDGTSADPIGDLIAISKELELFSPRLAVKPQVVVLNKIDVDAVKEQQEQLLQRIRAAVTHNRVMAISALTGENVESLILRTDKFLSAVKKQTAAPVVSMESLANAKDVDIQVKEDGYRVIISDPAIGQLLNSIDWEYYDAIPRFAAAVEVMGIIEKINNLGRGVASGARVLLEGGDVSKEFIWSMEGKELIPRT